MQRKNKLFSSILFAITLGMCIILSHGEAFAQRKSKQKNTAEVKKDTTSLDGFKFRHIGPAFMSGRIADVVLHPGNNSTWYVAVGSGGVWKTVNAGTTWTPLFDGQASYSIGCIALDPSNPEVVWVGSGENVGGRHVGYGDGIYRSADGGNSWQNLGLKQSEHISKIIIHPENPNIVWVAAQGPLWNKGGERGVFKTTDGGKTWNQVLGDNEWIGATDLLIDPRNPNRLYAATWQRHRTVAGYVGGGPGTAIYRSEDGGESWTKLSAGLPSGNMGKIGLAISAQQPDVVYAAIELERRKGGVYRSSNRGASWTKMSDEVSGGTGPHYYQELYACPHHFDRLYLVSNYMVQSNDGGKTFNRVNVKNKHVDDHVVVFRPDDPNYLMAGCDGGLYESFDETKTWRFVSNLPVTQFYKIAVDDAEPFYFVYGGTQDNNTQGGPSRTDNQHGIQNSDWFVVLGGDGHQPATEPGNPDIVYAQWQQGNLNRHDRRTGENLYIQPMASPDEPAERWNWDAPIVVSPHHPEHLYFASQRVWKSTNRGDSWTPISKDLTTQTERIETPFFGTTQGWDNSWDLYAMSSYSTITSLGVSPLIEGLIYAGTDDGLIQVSEDDGENWREINVGSLPGLPATAFVNDIKADLHDPNTVYAVFDNHKFGDYAPYLYVSKDRGLSWKKITQNLPDRTLIWRIVQDHVKPELLFLGTEFGVYFSHNSGTSWKQLKSGLPVIPVRDLAIQKRENDLVAGTFGRGIYILDDYSALRQYHEVSDKNETVLFEPRESWWYKPKSPLGSWGISQGDQHYIAPNPPFGVEFTYYLHEQFKSDKALRQEAEKKKIKQNQPLSFPGWDAAENEIRSEEPKVWLYIMDEKENILRRVLAKNAKGYQRVVWDMKQSSRKPVLSESSNQENDGGNYTPPGAYFAQLFSEKDDVLSPISEKVSFETKALGDGSLKGSSAEEVIAFQGELETLSGRNSVNDKNFSELRKSFERMNEAYRRSGVINAAAEERLKSLRDQIEQFDEQWFGSKARREAGENEPNHGLNEYLYKAASGGDNLSYGPAELHRQSAKYASELITRKENELGVLTNTASDVGNELRALGVAEWEIGKK